MKLAVLIVNYNVKYFLKQCLASVFGSEKELSDGTTLELDVWVVDNDSVDGSVEMVRNEFPEVHLIANHENVGFAKANNQALAQTSGSDFCLLLNPDTVVENDTFVKCVDFMRLHPDTGGQHPERIGRQPPRPRNNDVNDDLRIAHHRDCPQQHRRH